MTFQDEDNGDGRGGNIQTYSVEEISQQVKSTLDGAFGWIRVRGEVSSVSLPRSGHVYLTFKQERHELAAVMWKFKASRLAEPPREGIEYIATGNLTAYSGTSKYQLIIDRLEPAGEGALLAMIEQRKRKLQAEGLFGAEHKKSLPYLPGIIGVISSPGGAVIRDITRVLRDRFPRRVLLWPVAVQGQNCADEVERAIRGFNVLGGDSSVPRPDLLIVARGGGSMEDLLGFSEEKVVRAAFESTIPIISAVGHETDTPLIDLAADLRAPTPSVAAERAVPSRTELLAGLAAFKSRMVGGADRATRRRKERLQDLSRGISRPERLLDVASQRLDGLSDRLPSALRVSVQDQELTLRRLTGRLIVPAVVGSAERRLAAAQARLRPRIVEIAISGGRSGLAALSDRIVRNAAEAGRRNTDRLAHATRMLESLGYKSVIGRGFALVRDKGSVISTRSDAAGREHLEIEFRDGILPVKQRNG